jgi:2-dehydropantoate 2-reductase
MTIYILGMGAVGSLFGAILRSNGQNIVGLCRGLQYEAIKTHGLIYKHLDHRQTTIPINDKFYVYTDLRVPESGFRKFDPEDWIFITSKVYSLKSLLITYKDVLSLHGSIVLAQNGIGNEELVQKILPSARIYRILTTNGALLETPGVVQHTGQGYTKIGYPQCNSLPVDKLKLDKLVSLFNASVLSAELDPDIDLLLWEKIFVNIGINAIASIHNVPNGGLIESVELRKLMSDAITEAWKVAKAMNIAVDSSPNRYIEFTYSVCEKTRPNRNSMLQDLDKGRKTEIDFINGKIVKYGQQTGIFTPINQKLTQKIKELEKRN